MVVTHRITREAKRNPGTKHSISGVHDLHLRRPADSVSIVPLKETTSMRNVETSATGTNSFDAKNYLAASDPTHAHKLDPMVDQNMPVPPINNNFDIKNISPLLDSLLDTSSNARISENSTPGTNFPAFNSSKPDNLSPLYDLKVDSIPVSTTRNQSIDSEPENRSGMQTIQKNDVSAINQPLDIPISSTSTEGASKFASTVTVFDAPNLTVNSNNILDNNKIDDQNQYITTEVINEKHNSSQMSDQHQNRIMNKQQDFPNQHNALMPGAVVSNETHTNSNAGNDIKVSDNNRQTVLGSPSVGVELLKNDINYSDTNKEMKADVSVDLMPSTPKISIPDDKTNFDFDFDPSQTHMNIQNIDISRTDGSHKHHRVPHDVFANHEHHVHPIHQDILEQNSNHAMPAIPENAEHKTTETTSGINNDNTLNSHNLHIDHKANHHTPVHHGHNEKSSTDVQTHHKHHEMSSNDVTTHHKYNQKSPTDVKAHHEGNSIISNDATPHHGHHDRSPTDANAHHQHHEMSSNDVTNHHGHHERSPTDVNAHHQHHELSSNDVTNHHGHNVGSQTDINAHHELQELFSNDIKTHHGHHEHFEPIHGMHDHHNTEHVDGAAIITDGASHKHVNVEANTEMLLKDNLIDVSGVGHIKEAALSIQPTNKIVRVPEKKHIRENDKVKPKWIWKDPDLNNEIVTVSKKLEIDLTNGDLKKFSDHIIGPNFNHKHDNHEHHPITGLTDPLRHRDLITKHSHGEHTGHVAEKEQTFPGAGLDFLGGNPAPLDNKLFSPVSGTTNLIENEPWNNWVNNKPRQVGKPVELMVHNSGHRTQKTFPASDSFEIKNKGVKHSSVHKLAVFDSVQNEPRLPVNHLSTVAEPVLMEKHTRKMAKPITAHVTLHSAHHAPIEAASIVSMVDEKKPISKWLDKTTTKDLPPRKISASSRKADEARTSPGTNIEDKTTKSNIDWKPWEGESAFNLDVPLDERLNTEAIEVGLRSWTNQVKTPNKHKGPLLPSTGNSKQNDNSNRHSSKPDADIRPVEIARIGTHVDHAHHLYHRHLKNTHSEDVNNNHDHKEPKQPLEPLLPLNDHPQNRYSIPNFHEHGLEKHKDRGFDKTITKTAGAINIPLPKPSPTAQTPINSQKESLISDTTEAVQHDHGHSHGNGHDEKIENINHHNHHDPHNHKGNGGVPNTLLSEGFNRQDSKQINDVNQDTFPPFETEASHFDSKPSEKEQIKNNSPISPDGSNSIFFDPITNKPIDPFSNVSPDVLLQAEKAWEEKISNIGFTIKPDARISEMLGSGPPAAVSGSRHSFGRRSGAGLTFLDPITNNVIKINLNSDTASRKPQQRRNFLQDLFAVKSDAMDKNTNDPIEPPIATLGLNKAPPADEEFSVGPILFGPIDSNIPPPPDFEFTGPIIATVMEEDSKGSTPNKDTPFTGVMIPQNEPDDKTQSIPSEPSVSNSRNENRALRVSRKPISVFNPNENDVRSQLKKALAEIASGGSFLSINQQTEDNKNPFKKAFRGDTQELIRNAGLSENAADRRDDLSKSLLEAVSSIVRKNHRGELKERIPFPDQKTDIQSVLQRGHRLLDSLESPSTSRTREFVNNDQFRFSSNRRPTVHTRRPFSKFVNGDNTNMGHNRKHHHSSSRHHHHQRSFTAKPNSHSRLTSRRWNARPLVVNRKIVPVRTRQNRHWSNRKPSGIDEHLRKFLRRLNRNSRRSGSNSNFNTRSRQFDSPMSTRKKSRISSVQSPKLLTRLHTSPFVGNSFSRSPIHHRIQKIFSTESVSSRFEDPLYSSAVFHYPIPSSEKPAQRPKRVSSIKRNHEINILTPRGRKSTSIDEAFNQIRRGSTIQPSIQHTSRIFHNFKDNIPNGIVPRHGHNSIKPILLRDTGFAPAFSAPSIRTLIEKPASFLPHQIDSTSWIGSQLVSMGLNNYSLINLPFIGL